MSERVTPTKPIAMHQPVLQAPHDSGGVLDDDARQRNEPLAIIGMGCRFPGGANDPAAFWDLLRDGRDAIGPVPPERWDAMRLYDPNPDVAGTICTTEGGFLNVPVDGFDAAFFGITPREAANVDPQQRLLLEVAWEALEDAGLPAADLDGSRIGVFVGSFNNDYLRLQIAGRATEEIYGLLGTLPATLAGRLAYVLGLRGPTMQVDTACSSSLVALHLACQSLRQGECTAALVGSVSLMLSPEPSMYLSRMHVLAPDGRCKTFDARADGFGRGEGCGVLILKPLSHARAADDRILAVIRGSAVNHDGRSNGLTAPNGRAQQELLRAALRNAQVRADQIHYVEAHGTGTVLGDPIELQALGAIMGDGHDADHPLLVGSVKANVGHLEPVAGMAGLFKVILALQHGIIPPNLHLETPNPYIPWQDLPIRVPLAPEPWPAAPAARLAGVSSFGLTGTNAHVIVEEAPPPTCPAGQESLDGHSQPVHLLPVSARSPSSLAALVDRYAGWLGEHHDADLGDVCYTAGSRRSHHQFRTAFVGTSVLDLVDQMESVRDHPQRLLPPPEYRDLASRCHLAFVFPGQGSQWLGMGRDLLTREPAFRSAIDECERAMQPYVSWSLTDCLQQSGDGESVNRIDVIQPVLFAMQVALAAVWRAWGVTPDAVVGHSMGEVAAFYVAGALTLEDAARIICLRSQLLRRISGQGSMALVELPPDQVRRALVGYEKDLSVAVCNSRRSTAVSGDPGKLDTLLAHLDAQGIFCRRIKVDVAAHSPQVDKLSDELLTLLAGVAPRRSEIPIYSTVTSSIVDGTGATADYWVRNLRDPVLFAGAIELLRDHDHAIFIEISPHPLLLGAIEDAFAASAMPCRALPSLRRDEDGQRVLGESLAAVYTLGYPLRWTDRHEHGRCLPLPSYPWDRERFWLVDGPATEPRQPETAADHHPLLGRHLAPADWEGSHYWEQEVSATTVGALADHRVEGAVVLPGAAYIDAALAACARIEGRIARRLVDVSFSQMLTLSNSSALLVQSVLTPQIGDHLSFRIVSQVPSTTCSVMPAAPPSWTTHASGIIQTAAEIDDRSAPIDLADLQHGLAHHLPGDDFYARAARAGLDYGPAFRAITDLWYSDDIALARLVAPSEARGPEGPFCIHPALLDAAWQAVLGPLLHAEPPLTYLPVSADSVELVEAAPLPVDQRDPLWSYVRLHDGRQGAASRTADILLLNGEGAVLLATLGLHLNGQLSSRRRVSDASPLYHVHWQPLPALPSDDGPCPATAPRPATWLLVRGATLPGDREPAALGTADPCLTAWLGEQSRRINDAEYEIDGRRPEGWQWLLRAISEPNQAGERPVDVILYLAPPAAEGAAVDGANQVVLLLGLLQALTRVQWRTMPRLCVITQRAQQVTEPDEPVDLHHAPLWGMVRTTALEQPRLRCTLVDLPDDDPSSLAALRARLSLDDHEDQLALRHSQWYGARLTHIEPVAQVDDRELLSPGDCPFTLLIQEPGAIDRVRWRRTVRRPPAIGEVEVEVEASALNFLDVLKTLAMYPGQTRGVPLLGSECAGRIVAVGEGVTHYRVGEQVIAIVAAQPGAFSRFVTVPAPFVQPVPAGLSPEEAAALPLAFLTSWYALVHLARLRAGERALIHTASGGTGLAAVQVARLVGADVIATVGTDEKRDYLHAIGIRHVFSSRSLDFVRGVQAATGGAGIDVVLNTLTGEPARQSLALLRPFGRFVELSKRDIYERGHLPLALFQKNLSYMTVDVAAMLDQCPALVQQLMEDVIQRVRDGQLGPLPVRTFPAAEARGAFATMAQGHHIGKLVIDMRRRENLRLAPPAGGPHGPAIRPDAIYLITGGLGGLGLRLAAWLAEQGARHLILLGRHAPGAAARPILDDLRSQGVILEVQHGDVASYDAMAALFQRWPGRQLAGVFHLAAELDDATLTQLDAGHLTRVLRPKVEGAWNLHRLTRDRELDHFVLFSSAASVLGSPGQANYAAANAFLDALAAFRRQHGLPALSLSWGPWAEIGLAAAAENRGDRLAFQGLAALTPDEAIGLLEYAISHQAALPAHLSVMRFQVRQWLQSMPHAARSPVYSQLLEDDQQGTSARRGHQEVRDRILAASPDRRIAALETYLEELVIRVLRLSRPRFERDTSFKALGFDSLMAVEMRNLLEDALGVTLPTTLIWQYPTIAVLAAHLAGQLGATVTTQPPLPSNRRPDEDAVTAIPGDDLEQTLEAELNELAAEFLSLEREGI